MTLTIALTGGTGFIGKKIIKDLLNENFNVISLQRVITVEKKIKTRYIDLLSTKTITNKLLSDVDIIIHIAALVHNSKIKAELYETINYEATKKLFNVSKSLRLKKFIFISTVSVYGLQSYKEHIDINFPTNPLTEYAKSKLKSENFLVSSLTKDLKLSLWGKCSRKLWLTR